MSEPQLNDLQTKWLEALRSGDYQQGRLRLRTIRGKDSFYCCLGVLCDVVDSSAWVGEEWDARQYAIMPPQYITDDVDLSREQTDLCAYLNDTKGTTFVEIADRLERLWRKGEPLPAPPDVHT